MSRIAFAGILVLSFAVAASAADDNKDVKRYEGNGIAFNHPRDSKVQEKAEKGSNVLTIEAGKGGVVNISILDAAVDPKMLLADTVKAYRGIFKDVVKDSDKAVKRKIFGKETEGQQMDVMVAKDINIHNEFFAVASPGGKSLIITLTSPASDAATVKALAAIIESIEESKK